MSYNINIPHFQGPFDLLLFFIERDELDIYNIPIAKITDDFLIYLRELEAMNIDLASEFILVAATLMRIKAKMLLPRRELDEQGQEIDPRQELVERLLEYKRYKDILDELRTLEEERSQKERRGNINLELKMLAYEADSESEMESITLYKLLKAFDKIMAEFEERAKRPVHTITKYPYTLEGQRDFIAAHIKSKGKSDFKSLFNSAENRMHAIFTFLALLELIQMQLVAIEIQEGHNSFLLFNVENQNDSANAI